MNVVIFGLSGSGKSTLVATIRTMLAQAPQLVPMVGFPIRYATRGQRVAEDPFETATISLPHFDELVKDGRIPLWWERVLLAADGERLVKYGFGTMSHSVNILSANSSFLRSERSDCKSIVSKSLLVEVRACPDKREQRILKRSPEICRKELEGRVIETSPSIFINPQIIVENNDDGMAAIFIAATKVLCEVQWRLFGSKSVTLTA